MTLPLASHLLPLASLFQALPAVSNVFGVVLAFQLVFSILGMQLFMGALSSCTDPTISTIEACHAPPSPPPASPGDVGLELDAATYSYTYDAPSPLPPSLPAPPRQPDLSTVMLGALATASRVGVNMSAGLLSEWSERAAFAEWRESLEWRGGPTEEKRPPRATEARRRLKSGAGPGGTGGTRVVLWASPSRGDFDNFGNAMRLLYTMSTGDGWDAIMFTMMDATTAGHGPVRDDFSAAAIFAITWMFVGCYFAMNLFVGVIVDNFNRIKKEAESGGSATMTAEQQQWVDTMKRAAREKPAKVTRPPAGLLRGLTFRVVNSTFFDNLIMAVIVANVIVMGCDYWGIEQNAVHRRLYEDTLNYFAYVYYTECVLKLIGLSPAAYFADGWCRFDFALVCSSLLDQFAAELLATYLPMPPMLLRVLRIARILRILRLLKGAKELRNLIMCMVLTFPALINVGSVLLLAVFMLLLTQVFLLTYLRSSCSYLLTEGAPARRLHAHVQPLALLTYLLTYLLT